jgi:hypothetical protein
MQRSSPGAWRWLVLAAAAAVAAGWSAPAAAEVMAQKKCLKCHGEFKDMANVVAGEFQSRSNKAQSISVELEDGKIQVIKFTPQTEVHNVEGVKKLKKPIPVLVAFEERGRDLVATEITAKPVIQVPDSQQVSVQEMAALTKRPDVTIVDSRPPIRYQEGHIPGAVMMPFPKMPEMMDKLPRDKDAPIVFYCGGFR